MAHPEATPDEVKPTADVRVWDLPTRLFHWTVVGLILVSWISVEQGSMRLHLWSGSCLLALLLFRIVWGIVGSSTARFTTFVSAPRSVFAYLRLLASRNEPTYAGHNPAGGWMVVALITLLLAQAGTGLFSNDGVRFHGPLALQVSAAASDRITAVHGTLFNSLLLLTYIHVVAVFFYLFVKRANLITPMFTGRKPRSQVPDGSDLHFARAAIALAVFAVAAAGAWFIVRP